MMLIVRNLSKSYGIQSVLEDVSFVVNAGERVALIGPNGSGKTTLLRIIAGEEQPDAGSVHLAPAARLGYLRQGVKPTPGMTVGQVVRAGIGGWEEARRSLEHIAEQMAQASGDDLARLMDEYDRALLRFEALGGYAVEPRVEELLADLGLDGIAPDTPVEQLSGGEQTRAGLAGILLASPTLLLLDEPTNHLDIEALEWLEGFLAGYDGAVLIVSHDRTFLDRTVTRVLELDPRTHTVTEYPGTYSDYAEAKAAERERQWSAWKDQQAEIRRIQEDIHRTKMQAKSVEMTTTPRTPGPRRYAKKVAKKALAREKKLERYLASDERVEKPERHWGLKFDFGEMPRSGQEVLTLKGVGHTFDGVNWLFRDASATLRHGERIALLGPNGSGKSTLLRIIMGEIAPREGSVRLGANVRLGYMPQKQEALDPAATPLDVILRTAPMTETDARSFLHFFLFAGDDVFVPVGRLSYGERARLLLARLVAMGANCLVLDEPINHLDIESRERFEEALDAFPGTVLATVHDRAFIDRFATGIWAIEGGGLRHYIDRDEMRKTHDGHRSGGTGGE
ncbi:MAG TPA: ABC-F family ATP-binding cassette domain-containing protein [Aggregatilineales bacterium]|nr:ABC-F family ATP-binding cassette domain-containing protein [Aggregatilineales bacterium]HQE17746.1 ABC-F family ATP-binding cassette domain-containing protein [Aggregatilineales bacterium]